MAHITVYNDINAKTINDTIKKLNIALDQQQKLQLHTQQQPKQIGGFFKRLFGHKDE